MSLFRSGDPKSMPEQPAAGELSAAARLAGLEARVDQVRQRIREVCSSPTRLPAAAMR